MSSNLAMVRQKSKSLASRAADRAEFRRRLLRWYDRHRRNLPWRESRDPYRVWLSEIMLQQTRVAAVEEHYRDFLLRFPNVETLASASEPSVLAAWSGLGYYRRARMLHRSAKKVVTEHGGKLPGSSAGLRGLPGIGRYTAAAIASIAFDEPVGAVDGNVERVLRRVTARPLTGEELWQNAEAYIDRQRPGDSNEAMMELGATVCLPRQPLCLICPVFELCKTRGEGKRSGKRKRQNKRKLVYALSCRDDSVLLVQRPEQESLMPGMWELPECADRVRDACLTLRHSITTTDYTVSVVAQEVAAGGGGKWIKKTRVHRLPLTGLARKILRAVSII
jgi:A/G-specific adenine glycosylase